MNNIIKLTVVIVSSEDPIILDKMENDDLYEGTLTIDKHTAFATFEADNGEIVLIENCTAIEMERFFITLVNSDGEWLFDIVESEAE